MYSVFLSARPGDGSQSLGVLTAQLLSEKNIKTLLIDIKKIRTSDLILGLEMKLFSSYDFKGNPEIEEKNINLHYLSIDSNALNENTSINELVSNFNELKKFIEGQNYKEVIILSEERYKDIINVIGDRIFLVSAQDNISLKYLDTYLHENVRERSNESKYQIIINKFIKDEKDRLSSLDEIYEIFEEDICGIIPFSENMRIYTNTGIKEYLNKDLIEEMEALIKSLFKTSIASIDGAINNTREEGTEAPGDIKTVVEKRSIIKRISSLFRGRKND